MHKYIDNADVKIDAPDGFSEISEWVKMHYSFNTYLKIREEFEYYLSHRDDYNIDTALKMLDINF